jgi:protocatechuate 3,4-dioxygenase, alpha subunit
VGGLTPSQTVGPFLHIVLPWPDGPYAVPEGTPGSIEITGRVLDGAGEPVDDALVETWQADAAGRFNHPDDPRAAEEAGAGSDAAGVAGVAGVAGPMLGGSPYTALSGNRGTLLFGRCATDDAGRYRIVTVKPGPVPDRDGVPQAPHIDVSVFARGLLDRVVTRIYFGDETRANAADPVLATVPADRRDTLIAVPTGAGYLLDIHLQGERETVFFDV